MRDEVFPAGEELGPGGHDSPRTPRYGSVDQTRTGGRKLRNYTGASIGFAIFMAGLYFFGAFFIADPSQRIIIAIAAAGLYAGDQVIRLANETDRCLQQQTETLRVVKKHFEPWLYD